MRGKSITFEKIFIWSLKGRTMKPTSQRSAARQLGVALNALQTAIASGRVTATADGKIADVEVARAEWLANTANQGPAPLGGREAEAPAAEQETFNEARRRKEIALASLRENELQRTQGRFLLASEVGEGLAQEFSRARSQLLAIPSRVKQAAPHLTPKDLSVISGVIRQVLTDLADGIDKVPEPARKAAMQ